MADNNAIRAHRPIPDLRPLLIMGAIVGLLVQAPRVLRNRMTGRSAATARPGSYPRALGRGHDPRRVAAWIVALALLGLVGAGCTSPAPQGATATRSTISVATPTSAPLMPAPSDGALPDEVSAALQAVLDDWVAGDNGVGVTAAVLTADGAWAGAAGADGAGASLVPESAMAIASITKTFVAAEVMRLAGLGLVDLDGPVSDYVTVPFDTRGATVRQVLGMRSGFPLDVFDPVAVAADLDRSWSTDAVLAQVDAEGPRDGVLGDFAYNNLNYMVMGMLIEQVTGRPWAQAIRGDLLDPAGLDRVWVQDAQQPQPPLTVAVADSRNAVDTDGPWLPSRSVATSASAAGAMAADAPTLARWGYLLYGGRVIDASLVTQMTDVPEDDGYGLGTGVGVVDGDMVVGHAGDIGSYHGELLVWPERAQAIALLVPAAAGAFDVPAYDLVGQLAQAMAEP